MSYIGIRLPRISEGKSMATLINELRELPAEQLKTMSAEEPNFEIHATVGDIVFLPAGAYLQEGK